MSWLRSAVSKAVEVGGKNNLTRTVRNYADTVVQHAGQAVAEGAKIFQDRMGARNFKSFKHTVKRLEEVAVSCRGMERIQLLRRWLLALKEIEMASEVSGDNKEKNQESPHVLDDTNLSPRKALLVLYFDSDMVGEPMNFRDVFLHSQAIEGIILSMILEAPSDDEVSLLLEIFGLCFTGGREVHNAILSSIQDLAKAFESYNEEVLVKREELLQFVKGAISGLKLHADIPRIDAEAAALQQKLYAKKESHETQEAASEKTTLATFEALKEALAEVTSCSRLEVLFLKKKVLSSGDSPEIHSQKVDKMKILAESLANSMLKAEKRIADNRHLKEEALNFRVAKANEVSEIEKEMAAEIGELEKQRAELEAALKRINISLAAALVRLNNMREEKEQFDQANKQIVGHLKTKEDDLLRSVASCKTEANVVQTWINFLEDTWHLQSSFTEEKDKLIEDELEKSEKFFVKLVLDYLSAYKEDLCNSIMDIRKCVDELDNLRKRSFSASDVNNENPDAKEAKQIRHLEEGYLNAEAKIITTFSVVDNMREQFYSQQGSSSRRDTSLVQNAFDELEKMRQEFESIPRPTLEIETPSPRVGETTTVFDPKTPKTPKSPQVAKHIEETPPSKAEASADQPAALDPEAELAKLESEFGKLGRDYSAEEISGWEFDELEQELKSGDTTRKDDK
ncbi:uncharacterized protein LOC18440465 isoform X2 [Amborella trichopoda]|uniref:Uncharacterized protein n=1 Tax=Amborella trichopoda TaxID=13333 RepID=W1PQF3_AMBTC|nr:uncharacterized protein LOC18440465 isoform X2 [Amborella trichopoda]ERN12252.1 hypothetical protein AMTR_s00034p00227920 [Amborella trichopoda]|eukprot:XP_006850671.1 uncharacterized protein LOC18440465 isoform X2 [Amborella trichopoda]